jgi:hypothetical protein
MKKQLVTLMVACGFLATGRIEAQEKMPDKMSDDKMAHDKMGHKDKMKNKSGKSKNKKTDKMGGSKDKMGGRQNPQ